MAISLKTRGNVLLVFTGLVVAYVRNVVQYHHYFWDSTVKFFAWWFIHYIAVGIVTASSYFLIKNTEKIFFKYKESEQGLTWEQAVVYTSLIILVCSILVFLLAHWGGTSDYDGW
jgi:hypothetical protein